MNLSFIIIFSYTYSFELLRFHVFCRRLFTSTFALTVNVNVIQTMICARPDKAPSSPPLRSLSPSLHQNHTEATRVAARWNPRIQLVRCSCPRTRSTLAPTAVPRSKHVRLRFYSRSPSTSSKNAPISTSAQLIIRFIYPAGICQLRACSKTLRAMAERESVRCLRTKTVIFDGPGLARLVELSLSEKYAPLVGTLVFYPAAKKQTTTTTNTTLPEAGGDKMATFRQYAAKHAPETMYIMLALARMKAVKSVILGASIPGVYPANVRQRSLARHPPSMILAAIVASRAPLKHIIMWETIQGPCHGVKPRIMENLWYHAGWFEHLTTISLTLNSRNSVSSQTAVLEETSG